MASKSVEKQETAQVPDLVPIDSGFDQLNAGDIQPPRLKVASPTTGASVNGLVPNFCIFAEKGSEDPDPVVYVLEGADGPGLKIYPLKVYVTWAANVDPNNHEIEKQRGGQLQRWYNIDDAPAFVRANLMAPRYRQFNYVVYVPEAKSPLPHNLLLAKTSTPAARMINGLVQQRSMEGIPSYAVPFYLTPQRRERQGDDGQMNRWAVFQARPAEPDHEEVVKARELSMSIQPKPVQQIEPETVDAEPAPAI